MVTESLAQTPAVVISAPGDNSVNVSLTPSIYVSSNLDIDSLEITWGRWTGNSDLNGEDSINPTILVIEKEVYDTRPDSEWHHFAIGGSMDLVSDTVLVFSPFGLRHSTEYIVIVSGLYLRDVSNASVHFTDTIVSGLTPIKWPLD